MEPWVYGRPILSHDIAEIRRMKRTIEGGRDAHERNLKTGRGGIRDIEFIVQFLQLLLGNELPQVRSRATQEGLRRLVEADALQPGEARHLDDAYVFLRTAEHRLQTEEDQQVHSIPGDDEGVGRLALRVGFPGSAEAARDAFRATHARHTQKVREILDRLVHGAFAEEEERARRVVDLLLSGDEADEAKVHDAMEPFGFRDSAAALADLRRMASAGSPFLPRTRTYFASAAPMLLSRAAATPDPTAALALVERLSSRHAGSGLFFELLTENPDVLGVFCDLGGGSPYLSGLLSARPEIMDAFLDALVVGPRDELPPFEDLPKERLGESDDPVEALRNLRDLALLRTGVLDLQGRANARETARSLSRTATTVVQLATDAVCAELEGGGFAVLALGRLGAGEMAYGSDLDLLFVHEGENPELQTRRGRNLAAMLGGTGSRGPLYPVDLRLRPEGQSGPLVTSLSALEKYLGDRARTWERQALVRTAFVGGDVSTGERAMGLIHALLHGEPPSPDLLPEVRSMRMRVEENGTPGSLKTGRGGVQDAEFLAQGLVLQFGHEHESVRVPNTVDALQALRDEGLLRPEEYEGVITAYLFLRDVEMRIRVSSDASGSVFPRDQEPLDDLARRLGYVDTTYSPAGRSLEEEVDYYRDRLRVWFERIMTRLES
jgi:glutamate-ammonia-ligase adenylyltransferase